MLGAWSQGGGAWSWFPCYCFHFLSVLTCADVTFRRQRSKGSCEWMETVPPFVPSYIWVVHTLQIFPKQTRKNKGSKKPMTWWVSKAQKTNNGTESDTGRDLTSRPVRHLTPIMCFASVYLPTFNNSFSSQVILWIRELPSTLLLPIYMALKNMKNKLLKLVNYVSERDLHPPLVSLIPKSGPRPSNLLGLSAARYVVVGAPLSCCQWLSSWASRQQWHLHTRCLVPTVWSVLRLLLEKKLHQMPQHRNKELFYVS